MKNPAKILDELIARYPALEGQKENIRAAYTLLAECYKNGGKLLVCGNGGSASDSDHIVGELMKSFCRERPVPAGLKEKLIAQDPDLGKRMAEKVEDTLPAINLCQHTALSTAFANDKDPVLVFAQQVYGYGKPGDVLIGITTSGNSRNVVAAAEMARARGLKVIAMDGEKPGKLDAWADVSVKAPASETYKIQEYHLPVYHCLCLMLEASFWQDSPER